MVAALQLWRRWWPCMGFLAVAWYNVLFWIPSALVGCYGHKNKPGIMSPVYYLEIFNNSDSTINGNRIKAINNTTVSPPIE